MSLDILVNLMAWGLIAFIAFFIGSRGNVLIALGAWVSVVAVAFALAALFPIDRGATPTVTRSYVEHTNYNYHYSSHIDWTWIICLGMLFVFAIIWRVYFWGRCVASPPPVIDISAAPSPHRIVRQGRELVALPEPVKLLSKPG